MNVTKPNEQLIADLFDAQPESVIWFKPVWSTKGGEQVIDFEAFYCNVTKDKVIGARILNTDLLDSSSQQMIFEQCLQVWQTGEPLEHTYYNTHLKKYFNVLRSKVMDGILSVTRDRTAQVLIEKERERQNDLLNSILDASINAIFALDTVRDEHGKIVDFTFSRVNSTITKIVGKPADEIENTSFLQLYPTAQHIGLFELNCRVVETGQSLRREVYYKGDGLDNWFDVSMVKLGDNGLVVTFNDITGQKKDKQSIEEAAHLLQDVVNTVQNGIALLAPVYNEQNELVDFRCKLMNRVAEAMGKHYVYKTPETLISQVYPAYKEDGSFELFKKAIDTNSAQRLETHFNANGLEAWLDTMCTRLGNDLLVTFTDITPVKMLQFQLESTIEELKSSNENLEEYQQAIELTAQQLHTIINTSQAGIHTLVPVVDNKGAIIDFRFGIVNQTVAQYIGKNVEDLVGDLASNGFLGYKINGLFDIYVDTYNKNSTHRFDFNYNVDGHNVFFDILCTKLGDEVLVTFTDFSSYKKLQLDLEGKMEELKRSNASLEEFAYVASHDLQEPLRKINYFADRLKSHAPLDEVSLQMHERMEKAIRRMRTLIEDLLAYSQAGLKTKNKEEVGLAGIVEDVIADLEAVIQEKNAVISVAELPVITGDKLQLRQLFQNLISNALKYSKKEEVPNIEISAQQVSGQQSGFPVASDAKNCTYYLVEVKDNGIGFEQGDAERIFNIFQRLHGNKEYSGTGVGLSIARKVVENHQGFIDAVSQLGLGTTFRVLLPA
jgi:signal transduction histidine kinase/PAS domain-containing protein